MLIKNVRIEDFPRFYQNIYIEQIIEAVKKNLKFYAILLIYWFKIENSCFFAVT